MKTKTLKTVDIDSLELDLVVPVWDNCKVLRDSSGRFYLAERDRWIEGNLCRFISRGYAERLIEQAFIAPARDYVPEPRKVAAGSIG